jgi:hypothetical protein
MAGGRPTKYDPEYCDELIKHMGKGFSFESFAGKIGVSKETLYTWAETHKEFMDAKKDAFEQSRYFWENVGIQLATGQNTDANPTAWIFNMKNRFREDWNDKQTIQHEGNATAPVIFKLDERFREDI